MMRSALAHAFVPSPNVEPRRGDVSVQMIVLHYTGMESAKAACAWLCNPSSSVSCHYLVEEDGAIIQMVPEDMRAWHAGLSSWRGASDINSRSIGIEIQNPGHTMGYPDFPVAQTTGVLKLCHDIATRHDISPRDVVGHSDIAPLRKIDPGEKFDWAFLHREGIGHWVKPAVLGEGVSLRGETTANLQQLLAHYGYEVPLSGEYDTGTQTALAAFQRHFRPARVDGIADHSTVETLKRLIAALPG